MAKSIPMSPEQLPIQGYRIDIPLPPRPKGFYPIQYREADHQGLVPAKRPPSATYLAQLEWAWSPMNNAILKFHLSLNRTKTHWIGWYAAFNDNDFPWHWDTVPYFIAVQNGDNRDVMAVHMLAAMLENLRDVSEYDRFHWINDGGYLGVYRVEAIGDMVWGESA